MMGLVHVKLFRLVALIFALFTGSLTAGLHAEEIITRYHANISILANGDLKVTEIIKVIAEGKRIRRGIYRDFPTRIIDAKGRKRHVLFDVLGVKRDGKDEPWFLKKGNSATRIYIGDKNVYVKHGAHTYQITYRTDRQLRFFDTHDELYWNVSGTEWEFPIQIASASVKLPEGVTALDTFVFTGAYGSKDKFAQAKINDQGQRVEFETTRPLKAREGLTIGIKMAKGSFTPDAKNLAWFWRDYWTEICAAALLIFVSLYYSILWWKIGRDPKPGVIVPRWDAPDMSPAMVSYIDEKGFGSSAWKGLTSALLDLAVKGYVELKNLDSDPIITRTDKPYSTNLPVGEKSLMGSVGKDVHRSLNVDKKNGEKVKKMHSRFKTSMEREHRDAYYRHNWVPIIVGIFISVLGLAGILAAGGVGMNMILSVAPLLPLGIGASFVFSIIGRFIHKRGSPISRTIKIAMIVIIGFGAISVLVFKIPGMSSQPLLLVCFLGVIMANTLFYFLLGAPTQLGREKMDVIEGLRTYLQLAEKDRMNLAGAPTMSPKHFETLLPYAVALGVEKPWSNAFNVWLASAAAAASVAAANYYSPEWYHGNFNSDNIGDTFGSMASNIESSFTSALPVPKSSSSGFSSGGGFSGGGGGGGGGGGW